MKKQEAVNTFSDGLIMDLNPLSMPNTALTNCLNGTLLTYNGNENMLLNDMGNARVETAMLPTGYIPLGSTSFGGIIYIVSYNPLDGKYQIGSFPSPERNLSKDELENYDSTIKLEDFCLGEWKITTEKDEKGNDQIDKNGKPIIKAPYSTETVITNYYLKVNLLKKNIYPGDKYKIFSGEIHDKLNYISAWHENNNKYNSNYFPKYLKLDVISTQSNGKTINLTNDSVWTAPSGNFPYYIYDGTITKDSNGKLDLDEYRGLVGSNYDTYVSKLSGMLGIVAKLEVPTSFSIGYDVIIKENLNLAGKKFNKVYNLYFYLNWANDNEVNDYKNRINPKFIYTKILKIGVRGKSVHKAEIKLRLANGTTVVDEGSDALLDRDYATIEMPEYYNDDDKFDIVNYLENTDNKFNPAVLRKNDGTDFYYVIKGPIIGQTLNEETKEDEFYLLEEIQDEKSQSVKYNVKDRIAVNNSILDLTVTPVMPFGQLLFLEKQLYIDLSSIGSNAINILNYLYYVADDTVNMDFNIESYLTLGDHIKEVLLEFYTINDVLGKANWKKEIPKSSSKEKESSVLVDRCILQETYEEEDISIKTLNEDPAGGHKLTPIVIPENPITNIANGQCNIKFNRKLPDTKILDINNKWFEENKIYVVKINIKTKNSKRNRVFYRLFFNSPIFNTAYNSGKDFKDLYLIDSKVSYGLTPTVKLDTLPKPDIDPIEQEGDEILDTQSNLKKFYETPQADAGNSIIHKYRVKNEFNSGYSIVSELENEITLTKSGSSDNVESSSTHIKSDDKIIIITNPKLPKPSINDLKLNYSDEFTVEIPYTIIYNDIVSLKNYKLDKLSDASESIHAVIQHYSNEGELGAMELFIMPASNVSQTYTIDDRREEFYCPDENKNITFTMDNMALSIFDEIEEYDYCTLYFGIYWMKDNDCGYGYKTLTGANKPNFFIKLKKKPAICFMKINCVKASDGSIRFIFKQNETLGIPLGKDATNENYGNRFSNYNDIVGSANDASLIKNNMYYKYKDSGTVSTLYRISNIIEFPENPFITSTYTFNFKDLKFVVKIGDTTIRPDEYNVANNLKQNNNSTLSISTNVTNKIYNTEWVKNALSFDNSWIGLCEQKQISLSDLTKVFDSTGDNVVTALTIDKLGRVVLSEDYINNSCNPTRWYFGWEHTKPNTDTLPTTSSELGITSSSQYYKLLYLYSCKPFETVPKSSLETGFISGGNNSGFKDSEETGATGSNNSGSTGGNNSGFISGGNNSGAIGGNDSGFKDFEETEAT